MSQAVGQSVETLPTFDFPEVKWKDMNKMANLLLFFAGRVEASPPFKKGNLTSTTTTMTIITTCGLKLRGCRATATVEGEREVNVRITSRRIGIDIRREREMEGDIQKYGQTNRHWVG